MNVGRKRRKEEERRRKEKKGEEERRKKNERTNSRKSIRRRDDGLDFDLEWGTRVLEIGRKQDRVKNLYSRKRERQKGWKGETRNGQRRVTST